ncbi:hypothetical protein BKA70DRAFT_1560767 [Coprinopsis sp. MPI-PUGE-AT-0042]|nr:hypothetical protein BKA70DRAFT_1560767 [Coprinopsis sp. MPI-PUGE-AT-0042]
MTIINALDNFALKQLSPSLAFAPREHLSAPSLHLIFLCVLTFCSMLEVPIDIESPLAPLLVGSLLGTISGAIEGETSPVKPSSARHGENSSILEAASNSKCDSRSNEDWQAYRIPWEDGGSSQLKCNTSCHTRCQKQPAACYLLLDFDSYTPFATPDARHLHEARRRSCCYLAEEASVIGGCDRSHCIEQTDFQEARKEKSDLEEEEEHAACEKQSPLSWTSGCCRRTRSRETSSLSQRTSRSPTTCSIVTSFENELLAPRKTLHDNRDGNSQWDIKKRNLQATSQGRGELGQLVFEMRPTLGTLTESDSDTMKRAAGL